MDMEHVKAHRTKKQREKMTQIERFVTEGNENADELAKAGAMHQAMEAGRIVPAKEAKDWMIEGQKKKNHRKGVSEDFKLV